MHINFSQEFIIYFVDKGSEPPTHYNNHGKPRDESFCADFNASKSSTLHLHFCCD